MGSEDKLGSSDMRKANPPRKRIKNPRRQQQTIMGLSRNLYRPGLNIWTQFGCQVIKRRSEDQKNRADYWEKL